MNRVAYIDNLRIIACFLVILIHSTMPSQNVDKDGFWMYMISFIGSPSSELFLAVSGAVLLPMRRSVTDFYKTRFLKLLPPVVIWSVFGMGLYVLTGRLTAAQAIERIICIPFSPVIGVYWFIYVIIGLYLFAPVISAFLLSASKKLVKLYLLVWALTLCFPWVCGLSGLDFNQDGSHYYMLNYFGGFLGYWVLGYYLRNYPIKIGFNISWISLCALFILYPLSIALMRLYGIQANAYMDNLQIGSAVFVTMIFTIVQNIELPDKIQALITNAAKCSFGIYLIHIYLRDLVWSWFEHSVMHVVPKTLIISLLIMSLSLLVISLLSALPHGEYISGYKKVDVWKRKYLR